MKKRFVTITFKVNSLILATLILGIGLITLVLVTSFQSSLSQSTENFLKREAKNVYASVETIMLPGQAELATGLFKRFSTDSNARIGIFRTDGTQAFVDNNTIKRVNSNLKTEKFKERENPQAPLSAGERAFFDTAAQHPEQDEVLFTQVEGDKTYAQIFKPLLNIPKCTVCHGSDHTVRGIIDIKFDITESIMAQRNAILIAILFFVATVIVSAFLLANFMRQTIIQPVKQIGEVCLVVSQGSFDKKLAINKNDELGKLGETVNSMIDGLLERFKLSKYVSGSTIASIKSSEEGRRVHRVLFFSDVRGFTSFSEGHDAEVVVQELNHILSLQSEIIQSFGGDIDKYVGDEVMAIFQGEHAAASALNASLSIQKQMIADGKDRAHKLAIGIGLHEGEVIEGMIGSQKRADFTVIGDTVNLAARLCGSAEAFEILVSEQTIGSLKKDKDLLPDVKFRGPKELVLKGKHAVQKAYSIKLNEFE